MRCVPNLRQARGKRNTCSYREERSEEQRLGTRLGERGAPEATGTSAELRTAKQEQPTDAAANAAPSEITDIVAIN